MKQNQVKDGSNAKMSGMPTLAERSIWKGYDIAAMVVPFGLMLSHWAIFYVFSQNTHEVLVYPEANEICIAWIFVLLFLVLPLAFLPATYLFRRCNLFRIPFLYFIFINVERWYYGAYFCTNEMIDTHYILIYCIITLYIFELAELALRNFGRIMMHIRFALARINHRLKVFIEWIKEKANCDGGLTDDEIDQITKMMQIEDGLRKLKKEGKI